MTTINSKMMMMMVVFEWCHRSRSHSSYTNCVMERQYKQYKQSHKTAALFVTSHTITVRLMSDGGMEEGPV